MLTDWWLRLRSLFRRHAVERELDDELRFHLASLAAKYEGQGLGRDDAWRRARLEFGGFDQIKEEHRDARGIRPLADLASDVSYAWRQLRRSPGFAALAVLSLGLGIGVNTAVFSMVNALMLRPMPVSEPWRIVSIRRGEANGVTLAMFRELAARTRTLAGMTASFPSESDFEADGQSDFVAGEAAQGNYAAVLGLRAAIGRWFVDDREPSVVISYALWVSRFDGSPDVIGRTLRSGAETYTVVGVAPPEFGGVMTPLRTDIWVPIGTRSQLQSRLEAADSRMTLMTFGRLAAGATEAQAAAELNTIDPVATDASQSRAPIIAETVRGIPSRGNRRFVNMVVAMLTGVVGFVLLIACVNVGHLLLVRGAIRQRELAVRRALGASRFRLLRQLLIETLLLAMGGGCAGLVLAWWTTRLLERSFPGFVSVFALQVDLSLDWRSVCFATAVSLVATLLCGLLPAWRASRVTALASFKGVIGDPKRRPFGLVAQVVMSLVLLFVAGSFVQAIQRLQDTDPGFAVDNRIYAYVWPPSPPATAETRRVILSEALDRLRALPGVEEVAMGSTLPLVPFSGMDCISIAPGQVISTPSSLIGSGWLGTMRISLVGGRDFVDADRVATSGEAVIINEALSRQLWPGRAGLGERVTIGCQATRSAVVVGVVRDTAIRTLGEAPRPNVYRRLSEEHAGVVAIMVGTSRADADVIAEIRQALLALGERLRVYNVAPLRAHVEQSYAEMAWVAAIVAALGGLALLLAAVGLYGIIAFRVAQRTGEIGVRMALGARRADVFREVLRGGLIVVLIGVAIGEVVTMGVTVLLGSILQGVAPRGLTTHAVIAMIWIAVAMIACYLPAARASRVDPLTALRHD